MAIDNIELLSLCFSIYLFLVAQWKGNSTKINEPFTENRLAAIEHMLKQTALAVVNLTFLIRSCLIIAFLILLSTHLSGQIGREARISMTKQINSFCEEPSVCASDILVALILVFTCHRISSTRAA